MGEANVKALMLKNQQAAIQQARNDIEANWNTASVLEGISRIKGMGGLTVADMSGLAAHMLANALSQTPVDMQPNVVAGVFALAQEMLEVQTQIREQESSQIADMEAYDDRLVDEPSDLPF